MPGGFGGCFALEPRTALSSKLHRAELRLLQERGVVGGEMETGERVREREREPQWWTRKRLARGPGGTARVPTPNKAKQRERPRKQASKEAHKLHKSDKPIFPS